MQKMEELRDMLCEELDKITKKGELSAGSLDVVDKITHSIKSIDTIMAMNGYSNGYSNRNSYARRRDSMGRYSRDYGYSRDDEIQILKDQLREMRDMTQSEDKRMMIDNWMRQL